MKKFSLITLAVVLAFGFAVSAMFVSCDDGSSGGSGLPGGQTSSNPFKGTWSGTFRNQGDFLNGQTITCTFEDTTYYWVASGGFEQRGTYTHSGNSLNGLATHQRWNSGVPWDAFDSPEPWTGTLSGNTLTANGETMTKVR